MAEIMETEMSGKREREINEYRRLSGRLHATTGLRTGGLVALDHSVSATEYTATIR